jgi:hypothetical protein
MRTFGYRVLDRSTVRFELNLESGEDHAARSASKTTGSLIAGLSSSNRTAIWQGKSDLIPSRREIRLFVFEGNNGASVAETSSANALLIVSVRRWAITSSMKSVPCGIAGWEPSTPLT